MKIKKKKRKERKMDSIIVDKVNNFLFLESTGKNILVYPNDNSEGLLINVSGEVELFKPTQEALPKKRHTIYAVIGVINLIAG